MTKRLKPIVVLDAGHGLKTAGKRCDPRYDKKQTREWQLNNRIIDIAENQLEAVGVTVVRTDDTTGNKDVSLRARTIKANKSGASLLISMHADASGSKTFNGGGTTVFTANGSPTRMAEAKELYNTMIKYTKLKGDRAVPVQRVGHYITRNVSMPAFLVENGFMDSKHDVPIILSAAHAQKSADAVTEFVLKYLGMQVPTSGGYEIYSNPKRLLPTEPVGEGYGSSTNILRVQKFLTWYGLETPRTKKFDGKTRENLGKFQAREGLKKDYSFGPASKAKAKAIRKAE